MGSLQYADMVSLKTIQIGSEHEFIWITEGAVEGTVYKLVWPGTKMKATIRRGKREINLAISDFSKLARRCERLSDEQMLPEINTFASRFGPLYGDIPTKQNSVLLGTLDNWKMEFVKFLDMLDISNAIKRGTDRSVLRRIRVADRPQGKRAEFEWRNGWIQEIEGSNEKITMQIPGFEDPQVVNMIDIFRLGTPKQKLWALFSGRLNNEMRSRLSLAIAPNSKLAPAIAPNGILAVMYTKLWLDVVATTSDDQIQPIRTCAAPNCDNPLPANSRVSRRTCSEKCRKAYNRAKPIRLTA